VALEQMVGSALGLGLLELGRGRGDMPASIDTSLVG